MLPLQFLPGLILLFADGMLTAQRWHVDVSLKLRAGGEAVRPRKSPAEGLRAVAALFDGNMRRVPQMAGQQNSKVSLDCVLLC